MLPINTLGSVRLLPSPVTVSVPAASFWRMETLLAPASPMTNRVHEYTEGAGTYHMDTVGQSRRSSASSASRGRTAPSRLTRRPPDLPALNHFLKLSI